MKRLLVTCLLLAGTLCGAAAGATAATAATEPVSDVRILIDVSGSMKWNDPHNLRAPALRLIVGLLPPGAKAGVWTFGQYVNMLVPLGAVDEKWKKAARRASAQINSNGLYTNIEEALKRATWDWDQPDPRVRRSIIMLTDGIVDVSKDDAKDAASRKRILDDILPRLQKAGVKIHTIALSNGADETLLKQLSAGSGGWHEQVASADELERAFLHVFEKAAHRDSLPLIGNRINVDDSIQELTLLVFRKENAKPTQLVNPLGKTIAQEDAPDQVHWHHETRYDLITIEKPMAGKWQVLADTDPDNRVMIVTNLKLETTQLPNHVLVGRKLPVTVRLTQNGQTITKPAFLKFVDVKLTQSDVDGKMQSWQMADDGHGADKTAHDGVYSLSLGGSLTPGQHEIRMIVDGITFQREARQLIVADSSPVITTVSPDKPDKPRHYTLSVIPRVGLIDPAAMSVHATVTDPQGHSKNIEIPRAHDNEWSQTLTAADVPGIHTLNLKIQSKDPDGKVSVFHVGPLSFGTPVEVKSPPVAAAAKPAPAPAAVKNDVKPVQSAAAALPGKPAPPVNWNVVAGTMILLNLGVFGGGYIVYRRTHKKPDTSAIDAIDATESTETTEVTDATEEAVAEEAPS